MDERKQNLYYFGIVLNLFYLYFSVALHSSNRHSTNYTRSYHTHDGVPNTLHSSTSSFQQNRVNTIHPSIHLSPDVTTLAPSPFTNPANPRKKLLNHPFNMSNLLISI